MAWDAVYELGGPAEPALAAIGVHQLFPKRGLCRSFARSVCMNFFQRGGHVEVTAALSLSGGRNELILLQNDSVLLQNRSRTR